jgi:hypothetical protein
LAEELVTTLHVQEREAASAALPVVIGPETPIAADALGAAERRNASFLRAAPLALLYWLEKPVDEVLPDRQKLELEAALPDSHVLTFGEYLYGALGSAMPTPSK